MAAIGESRDALDDVAPAADLQNVAPEGVWALLGYNNRRFRLVLRPGRASSRPSTAATWLRRFVVPRVLIVCFALVISALFIFGIDTVGVWVSVAVAAIGRGCIGVAIAVLQEFLLSSVESAMVVC